jgi:hypothetical protein
MSNPWDVPPFPTSGDDDPEYTYAGVGRVLSQWETAELELGAIYGLLLNRPDDVAEIRQYGVPNIFEERAKALWAAAEYYFTQNPHQDTEAELSNVLSIARRFSARRNDVAHSIVKPIQWIRRGGVEGPLQFGLVPPNYLAKKFDVLDMPTFVYTSVELNRLSVALHYHLVESAQRLRFKFVLGEDGAPPRQR